MVGGRASDVTGPSRHLVEQCVRTVARDDPPGRALTTAVASPAAISQPQSRSFRFRSHTWGLRGCDLNIGIARLGPFYKADEIING